MKILLLCDRYPYPLEQGLHLRLFNFIKYLPSDCTTDLFCYGEKPVPEPLIEIFSTIYPNQKLRPTININVFQRIARWFNPKYFLPCDPVIESKISKVILNSNYDIILATTGMLPYINPDHPLPVVVDVIDDSVLEWWREYKVAPTIQRKFKTALHLFRNYLFEKHYLSNQYIDACFFTSEIDASVFKKICSKTRTEVIQNGVDGEFYRPQGSKIEPNTLIFEGNMSFPPNVDGAIFFCKEIFPLILKHNQNTKLLLVGKSPAPEISALASKNIIVTGFVDDVRPYISSASVFVCPLRKGGGIKNKLLQAWSMGKACVATPFSIGGLNAYDGENILVRDSKQTFAQAVIDLLANKEQRSQLGRNARNTIELNYTWEKKSGELHKLLKECIDKKCK